MEFEFGVYILPAARQSNMEAPTVPYKLYNPIERSLCGVEITAIRAQPRTLDLKLWEAALVRKHAGLGVNPKKVSGLETV